MPRPRFRSLLVVAVLVLTVWVLAYSFLNYESESLVLIPFGKLYKNKPIVWNLRQEHYPVTSMIPIPTASTKPLPKIQHVFDIESIDEMEERENRQDAVLNNFLRIWEAYKQRAGIGEEFEPESGKGLENWADILIESLDTLIIMDLQSEFDYVINYVYGLDFTKSDEEEIDVAITGSRHLGGLLAAYDRSDGRHSILLEKAVELGDMLYAAFDTPDRMPILKWKWKMSRSAKYQATKQLLDPDMTSLSLEYTRLSQLVNDVKYFDAAQRVTNKFAEEQSKSKMTGLWPVNTDSTLFTLGTSHNMIQNIEKQYILLGGASQQHSNIYESAIEAAKSHLLFRAMNPDDVVLAFVGNAKVEMQNDYTLHPTVHSSTCSVGGTLAIGSKLFDRPDDLILAEKLVEGCFWAHSTPTGIIPETFEVIFCNATEDCTWNEKVWYDGIADRNPNVTYDPMADDKRFAQQIKSLGLPRGFTSIPNKRYLLRPDTIKSIFNLYRITGDRELLDAAWQIFQSIYEHTYTSSGNTALGDVTVLPPPQTKDVDTIEMIQILKYLYLLYSDPRSMNLDNWVFNSQGHAFKRP